MLISNPPFPSCSYSTCDLPGQCVSEGKCHHPVIAPKAPASDLVRRLRDQADRTNLQWIDNLLREAADALSNAAGQECGTQPIAESNDVKTGPVEAAGEARAELATLRRETVGVPVHAAPLSAERVRDKEMMNDLVTYGQAWGKDAYGQDWSKDGKRIDPRITRIEPTPVGLSAERVREIAITCVNKISFVNEFGGINVIVMIDGALEAIVSAINLALSEAGKPGYVLVPREPSEEMVRRGLYAGPAGFGAQWALGVYKAMLAAAPAEVGT